VKVSVHPLIAAVPVLLTTLLSWTWIAFAMEADNAVEAAGSERISRLFRISISMWANGLRFIDGKAITSGVAGWFNQTLPGSGVH
jgi:hypothetical protein